MQTPPGRQTPVPGQTPPRQTPEPPWTDTLWQTPPLPQTPIPPRRYPCPWVDTLTPVDGQYSGRYASYWNAFLFISAIRNKTKTFKKAKSEQAFTLCSVVYVKVIMIRILTAHFCEQVSRGGSRVLRKRGRQPPGGRQHTNLLDFP